MVKSLPGPCSWKMVELRSQPGLSGLWALALTYSAHLPLRMETWSLAQLSSCGSFKFEQENHWIRKWPFIFRATCCLMGFTTPVCVHACAHMRACVCVCTCGEIRKHAFLFFVLVSWPTTSCLSNEMLSCFGFSSLHARFIRADISRVKFRCYDFSSRVKEYALGGWEVSIFFPVIFFQGNLVQPALGT